MRGMEKAQEYKSEDDTSRKGRRCTEHDERGEERRRNQRKRYFKRLRIGRDTLTLRKNGSIEKTRRRKK